MPMIAYEILCQSIEDWRAGRRPTAHIPGPAQAPNPYEQVDSGVVEVDDDEMQVEMDGDGEGDAYGGYGYEASRPEAGAPGEQMGPTGTPPAYTTDMPPPYDAGQPAPYTEMIPTHEDSEDVEHDDDGVR